MTRAVLLCAQCGAETGHAWHPARGQWLCDGCGRGRWPAEIAEERTAAIALPVAPAPVLKGDS